MKVEGRGVTGPESPSVIQIRVTLTEVLDEDANRAGGPTLPLPGRYPVWGFVDDGKERGRLLEGPGATVRNEI